MRGVGCFTLVIAMMLVSTGARYWGGQPWFHLAVTLGTATASAALLYSGDRTRRVQIGALLAVMLPAATAAAWGYVTHPSADDLSFYAAGLYFLGVLTYIGLTWFRGGRAHG